MNRRKTNLLFCALLFSCMCQAQELENFISWDTSYLLKWEDFKGEPSATSPFYAYTYSAFGYKTAYKGEKDFVVTVYTRFDKTKSWKTQKISDPLLKHEQCHFDAAEIFTRIFVKRIQQPGVVSKNKLKENLPKIMKEVSSELWKFNDLYDAETNHSKNAEKQKEWEDKIDKMLEQNKQYALREINFHL